jgi:hypothetical protein
MADPPECFLAANIVPVFNLRRNHARADSLVCHAPATVNKLRPKVSPWGAKDCSGNPFCRPAAKRLQRKAWFLALRRQKGAHLFLNLLTVMRLPLRVYCLHIF